jgi:FkbM family methyltransferase
MGKDMKLINTMYGNLAVHENDLIGNKLSSEYIWEPYNIALMKEYIKDTDIVLDIGANIGFFTVVLSDIVKLGHVHSFEPIPENYNLLQHNASTLMNVTLYNCALGKESGHVDMKSEHGNMGNSYVVNESAGSIPIHTLDSLQLSPNFIKMDVQGFEYDVLLGGIEMIKKCRPIMIIELEDSNGSIPTSFKQSKHNSIQLLKSLDYTLYNIKSDYPVDYLCLPN